MSSVSYFLNALSSCSSFQNLPSPANSNSSKSLFNVSGVDGLFFSTETVSETDSFAFNASCPPRLWFTDGSSTGMNRFSISVVSSDTFGDAGCGSSFKSILGISVLGALGSCL